MTSSLDHHSYIKHFPNCDVVVFALENYAQSTVMLNLQSKQKTKSTNEINKLVKISKCKNTDQSEMKNPWSYATANFILSSLDSKKMQTNDYRKKRFSYDAFHFQSFWNWNLESEKLKQKTKSHNETDFPWIAVFFFWTVKM